MPIRILLVDDHDLIRQGLRKVLENEPDMSVVADVASCAAALEAVPATSPTVTILDIGLPDGNGVDLVPRLKQLAPSMGVVVLTMYDDDEHLFRTLDVGASAFIAKSAPSPGLVAAVRHAAASPHTFSAVELGAAMRRRTELQHGVTLTEREVQIIELLKLGLSVNAIAARLFISPSTTKTHLSKAYEKLGAGNRTQAVMQALRLGLVSSLEETGSLRSGG